MQTFVYFILATLAEIFITSIAAYRRQKGGARGLYPLILRVLYKI